MRSILALLVVGSASGSDAPIAANGFFSLDGSGWTAAPASDPSQAIAASVPGDIVTDLANAGIIPMPWLDLTWRAEAGRWDLDTWTYETDFETPEGWAAVAGAEVWLVFDSVKMAADISLNGAAVGAATNQHLRYTFSVGALLAAPGGALNRLTVTFPPTVSDTRNDAGRFMGCSGGWDWAPYSNETTGRTPKGIRTFSKGIVKSAYLSRVAPAAAAITAVKPLVVYQGAYPTTPLTDATAGAWRVDVVVYLLSPTDAEGALIVTPAWGGGVPVSVPVVLAPHTETAVNVSLAVPAGAVSLWWPVAMPPQQGRPLYAINATFVPAGAGAAGLAVSAVRRVGFRTLALVTGDDTHPAALAGVPGSGYLTVRLKVNGADIWARGANWIPLEETEGRNSDGAHAAAVASAAAAGMNIMRIWGGGVYPPDAFFDACDAAGVLVYLDAMYASQADSHHFPSQADPAQAAELQQAVRRLAAHPSLALYSQGNECGGSGPFVAFVGPTLAAEDPSRPVWPCSPSSGWADGVDRLWGTPLPGRALRIIDAKAPVGPVPGRANCTAQSGAFAYGFPLSPFLDPLPAPDAAACCALCEANPACALGNYEGGGCQLVAAPFATLFRDHDEFQVLFPPRSASLLMPVPAPNRQEIHGPYQGGGGWPTVNGGGPPASAFAPQVPPSFAAAAGGYGPAAAGSFTSEFGVGQPASFEVMAPTLSPTFWSMHGGAHPADTCSGGFDHICSGGNVMAQRNYGCDDAWATYFPSATVNVTLDDVSAPAFAAQLYLCQLATALDLQSTVQAHRAGNLWGLLTWQLGEVWPTYGWGSLEYSSGPGSVTGGRWKPSHYALARAYAALAVACSDAAQCYVKNDDPLAAVALTVAFAVTRLRDGSTAPLGSAANVSLPRGANAIAWACAGGGAPPCPAWAALLPAAGCAASGVDCLLTATLTDAGGSGAVLARHTQLLVVPGRLQASRAVRVAAAVGEEAADGSVPVTLTATAAGGNGSSATAPALFVTLFTEADGRFSDNFITLLPGGGAPTVVTFLPFAPQQRGALAATLRVNALGELLNAPPPPRPAAGNCTTRADTDVNDPGVMVPGDSLAACCAACWADPSQQCLAAAFDPAAPNCWLKYGTNYVPKPGVQTCTLDL